MLPITFAMLTVGLPAQPLTLPQTKTPATVLQSGGSTPVPAPPTAKPVPPPPVPSLPTDPAEAEALASVLRDLLKKNMPDPITKSNHNWGHQKAVNVTMHHHEGLKFWSETVQEMKNDGTWRRTDIRIPDRDKVTLEVKELTHPEEGKMLATLSAVAERVDLHFEQQIWHTGIRLYSGETRGHCKGALLVKAEVETKTEIKKGSFFPTVSLKLHVISAELFYEKLVVDHTAGLDGEAAKALGDLTISIIKAIKPHLEKDLLEKADAAIVKAAQSKELTVTLDKLMAAKKKDPPKKTEPPKK